MQLTNGLIDLHYHSAPDRKPRKLNDLELMEQAVAIGARAVVIKTHYVPTMDRAALVNLVCRERHPDANFTMFGGIALNYSVGGLNPHAVEAALLQGAKVVWLPTLDAENEYIQSGKSGGIALTENGKAAAALRPIFELIRDHDAILQTGHAGAAECFPLVEAARAAGVQKIVVTHPEYHVVGMTLEERARIVQDYGVFLELEFAQPRGGKFVSNLEENVRTVQAIGSAHIVLASDSGQTNTPVWCEAVSQSLAFYAQRLPREAVLQMTQRNPAMLLGVLPC